MRILSLLLSVILFTSCNNQKSKSILNTDSLPRQVIKINTTRDTVVRTANGALLEISKESFSGGNAEVILEVREAYSFEEIIQAGLTTQSNGQPLSSGGMIYINAVGENNIKITKSVKVSLPAEYFDERMKLYKGEEKEGSINWTDQQPIADVLPENMSGGKAIFQSQCATCHAFDKDLTGPALFGVENRGPWKDRNELIKFTHNPGGYIPFSEYTQCLTVQYGSQVMPSFPQLSSYELYAVYDYIKNEERKAGLSFSGDACADSCRRYDSVLTLIKQQNLKRQNLINDNDSLSDVDYKYSNNSAEGQDTTPGRDVVTMENNKAVYYKFSIEAFGWWNVDLLLKENDALKESTLTVRLQGQYKVHVDIYLAIPSLKIFAKGGRTNNEDEFAFDTKDGKIQLPESAKAYIFAMSEIEENILFDYKEFTISLRQQIPIEVKPSTKENVYALFRSFKFSQFSVKVEDSKNANEIRKANKEIKTYQSEAERFKPKNCDCFCQQLALPSGDSTYIQ
jgi:mono/diheme cytochrome c family protein